MQAQQLIEELHPHNLPHIPNGSFIITSKQRDAIESLLSQQAVVAPQSTKQTNSNYKIRLIANIERTMKQTGILDRLAKGSKHFDDYQETLAAFLESLAQQLSKEQQPQLIPEAMQAAAKEYADSQFILPYEDLPSAVKDAWIGYYEGYLAGKSANGNP